MNKYGHAGNPVGLMMGRIIYDNGSKSKWIYGSDAGYFLSKGLRGQYNDNRFRFEVLLRNGQRVVYRRKQTT